nr:MAG TPA: hypothetical protein [Caudoviricetes sp.]
MVVKQLTPYIICHFNLISVFYLSRQAQLRAIINSKNHFKEFLAESFQFTLFKALSRVCKCSFTGTLLLISTDYVRIELTSHVA